MNVRNPKIIIPFIMIFSFLWVIVIWFFLHVHLSYLLTGMFAFWLFAWVLFDFAVLGANYGNAWTLFWKAGNVGWVIRKWKDNFLSLKVEKMPLDGFVNFPFKAQNENGEWITKKDSSFVTNIEAANGSTPLIIAKQGVINTINLAAPDYCPTCGFPPAEAEGTSQIISDWGISRFIAGKLSVLQYDANKSKMPLAFWLAIGLMIILMIGLLLMVNGQGDTLTQILSALGDISSKFPTPANSVVAGVKP